MIDLASILGATTMPTWRFGCPSGRTVQRHQIPAQRSPGRQSYRADRQLLGAEQACDPFGRRKDWPEYALVRLFSRAGGTGVGSRTGQAVANSASTSIVPHLSSPGRDDVPKIHERAAALRGAGSWDAFAWNGPDVLFIESKQHRSSDSLNPNERAWLEAALEVGHLSSRSRSWSTTLGGHFGEATDAQRHDFAPRLLLECPMTTARHLYQLTASSAGSRVGDGPVVVIAGAVRARRGSSSSGSAPAGDGRGVLPDRSSS